MPYSVKEIFYSLQGEGLFAGRPAVFVRFAGCNQWSGREQDRDRPGCASWCDTDFVGTDGPSGGKYTADELVRKVAAMWPQDWSVPYVVLTGGEPMLQVDGPLLKQLAECRVAIETNGTIALPRPLPFITWVTLSPKPGAKVVLNTCDEVKLVYPNGCELAEWDEFPSGYRFLQPMWSPNEAQRQENLDACIEYCLEHPGWRLGLQLHKEIGLQ